MNSKNIACSVYVDGDSFSSVVNSAFVRRTATDVVKEVSHLRGAAMLVSGYTLMRDEHEQMYLVLTLYVSADRSWIFGIGFGNGAPMDAQARAGLNAVAWRKDSQHPLAAGIRAANWDEAWKIVCTVGQSLGVSDIQLRYGG